MKNFILIVTLLYNLNINAQKPCEFSVNVTDSLGTYKETKSAIVHEFVFGNTSKHIFFALTSTNDMPLLSLLILQKSKDFLKINCFDKNSRIYLQLENNKVITLIASEEENCGTPAITARCRVGLVVAGTREQRLQRSISSRTDQACAGSDGDRRRSRFPAPPSD